MKTLKLSLVFAALFVSSIAVNSIVQELPARDRAWTTECSTTWDEEGNMTRKQTCTSGGEEWPCDCGWGDPVY